MNCYLKIGQKLRKKKWVRRCVTLKQQQLYKALSQVSSTETQSVYKQETQEIYTKLKDKKSKPVKVLIAEDHKVNMALCKIFVKQIIPDVIIFEATNENQAVNLFKVEQPSIIFMDIQMPEMNGYDASATIRKMETTGKVPIIALTAGTVKGEKEKCRSVGMDDYISKPFEKATLERVIKKLLP